MQLSQLSSRRWVRSGTAAFLALAISTAPRPANAQGTGWLMEGCIAKASSALPGDVCFQSLWTWRTVPSTAGRFLTNFSVSYPNQPTNQYNEIVLPSGVRLSIFPEFVFFTTDGRTLNTINDGDYYGGPIDFVPAAITGKYDILGADPQYLPEAPFRFTLVSVVPEPQTYALVAIGLLAIGVAGRRRRSRRR